MAAGQPPRPTKVPSTTRGVFGASQLLQQRPVLGGGAMMGFPPGPAGVHPMWNAPPHGPGPYGFPAPMSLNGFPTTVQTAVHNSFVGETTNAGGDPMTSPYNSSYVQSPFMAGTMDPYLYFSICGGAYPYGQSPYGGYTPPQGPVGRRAFADSLDPGEEADMASGGGDPCFSNTSYSPEPAMGAPGSSVLLGDDRAMAERSFERSSERSFSASSTAPGLDVPLLRPGPPWLRYRGGTTSASHMALQTFPPRQSERELRPAFDSAPDGNWTFMMPCRMMGKRPPTRFVRAQGTVAEVEAMQEQMRELAKRRTSRGSGRVSKSADSADLLAGNAKEEVLLHQYEKEQSTRSFLGNFICFCQEERDKETTFWCQSRDVLYHHFSTNMTLEREKKKALAFFDDSALTIIIRYGILKDFKSYKKKGMSQKLQQLVSILRHDYHLVLDASNAKRLLKSLMASAIRSGDCLPDQLHAGDGARPTMWFDLEETFPLLPPGYEATYQWKAYASLGVTTGQRAISMQSLSWCHVRPRIVLKPDNVSGDVDGVPYKYWAMVEIVFWRQKGLMAEHRVLLEGFLENNSPLNAVHHLHKLAELTFPHGLFDVEAAAVKVRGSNVRLDDRLNDRLNDRSDNRLNGRFLCRSSDLSIFQREEQQQSRKGKEEEEEEEEDDDDPSRSMVFTSEVSSLFRTICVVSPGTVVQRSLNDGSNDGSIAAH